MRPKIDCTFPCAKNAPLTAYHLSRHQSHPPKEAVEWITLLHHGQDPAFLSCKYARWLPCASGSQNPPAIIRAGPMDSRSPASAASGLRVAWPLPAQCLRSGFLSSDLDDVGGRLGAEAQLLAKGRGEVTLSHVEDEGPVELDVSGTLVSKGLEVLA